MNQKRARDSWTDSSKRHPQDRCRADTRGDHEFGSDCALALLLNYFWRWKLAWEKLVFRLKLALISSHSKKEHIHDE